MANHSKDTVNSMIKPAPFTIATDSSNNADAKMYPIIVSFFSPDLSQIEYHLLSIPILHIDSTGAKISQLIVKELEKGEISVSNCLALSVDNVPVIVGMKYGEAEVSTDWNFQPSPL